MKNFKSLYISTLSLLLIFVITACNHDKIKPGEKGPLTLHFENMLGESDLMLGTGSYINASNDTFTIGALQYYISNIQLKTADGTVYRVPQDNHYYLVRQDNAESQDIPLTDVPAADYTSVTFMIGVDSLRSTMSEANRMGDLDIHGVAGEMYWDAAKGYIFFKMAGTSPQIPADSMSRHDYFYAIGGYNASTLNNIRKVSLSCNGESAVVREDRKPEIHIKADILKVFTGTKNIKLADKPTITFDASSLDISANYMNMFNVEHVHNDH